MAGIKDRMIRVLSREGSIVAIVLEQLSDKIAAGSNKRTSLPPTTIGRH